MLNPKWIREYAPGIIGGEKVAEKATDEEVLLLAKLADEESRLYNRLVEVQKEFNRLVEAIKRR